MITLAIIALLMLIFAWITDGDYVCFPMAAIASLFLLMFSLLFSAGHIPAGYTKVDSVSYMTEAGYIETLDECNFYTDGTNYYEQEFNTAAWVPFAPAEYVKVELPGKVVSWSAEDGLTQTAPVGPAQHFCTVCGHKLNVSDKFCSGCGTGQPDRGEVAERFCTNCGKELNDTDKFCGGCGAAAEAKK